MILETKRDTPFWSPLATNSRPPSGNLALKSTGAGAILLPCLHQEAQRNLELCSKIGPPQTDNPLLNAGEPFMEFEFGIHRQSIHSSGKAWHSGKTGYMKNLRKPWHPDNIPDGNRKKRDVYEIRVYPEFGKTWYWKKLDIEKIGGAEESWKNMTTGKNGTLEHSGAPRHSRKS